MAEEEQNRLRDILMRQRTVALTDDINHQSAAEVAGRLLTLQAESTERINLIIDSAGGENRPALQLCDFISNVMTAPVRGIAMGSCKSAATFVMLHCDERVSLPHARFMIHSGRITGISLSLNNSTPKDLELLLTQSKEIAEEITALYMQKLKMNRKKVEALIKRGDQRFDDTISATEAVKIGLVERIVTDTLDIFPKTAS
jgi:ATP-dependent protease ClpP protease subunit